MSSHIILGLNVDLGNIKRVKVDNFNFETEIKQLKIEASKQSEVPPDTLELVHQGRILEENKTLKDYTVRSGDVVYVLKKYKEPVKETKPTKTSLRSYDIHTMVLCKGIRTGSLTSFINALEPVFKPENIEKFISIAPELETDPVAISFLTAPELLFLLQDPDTFANVNKDHPVLVPAFVKIYKALLGAGPSSDSLPPYVQHMIESEEEYEDVELMDPEEYDDDSDNQGGERLITAEQLSAALAMARAASSNTNSNAASNSGSGPSASSSSSQIDTGLRDFLGSLLSGDSNSPSNSGTPSRSLITRDMFSSALSHAFSSVSNPSTSDSNSGEPSHRPMMMPTFTPSDSPTFVPSAEEITYSDQLTRMKEMGLSNRRLNLRALIVCNGDVSTAINLILSGAIDD